MKYKDLTYRLGPVVVIKKPEMTNLRDVTLSQLRLRRFTLVFNSASAANPEAEPSEKP